MRIDAVDISAKALQKAKQGGYGEESFRNKETLNLRDRYFEKKAKLYQVHAEVKTPIRFLQGNLLDAAFLKGEKAYDVVFCRNLLIYLGQDAKKHAVDVLSRVLAKTGILFVGHAERPVFDASEFEWIRQLGVFACRRAQPETPPKKRVFPKLTYIFERRKTQRRPEQKPLKRAPRAAIADNAPVKADAQAATVVERRRPSEIVTNALDKARQLADQGELKEALALCEQGLRENPTDVQANFLTGLIWLALGEDEQAEKFFTKTVYLNPKHQESLNYLAFIAEYRGDHEKARLLRQRLARVQKHAKVED
jgi:chemotaxis protein methyltransferase WspC